MNFSNVITMAGAQFMRSACGWSDLDLGHGFHATKQGERYTLSEPTRPTVLAHLLPLMFGGYLLVSIL